MYTDPHTHRNTYDGLREDGTKPCVMDPQQLGQCLGLVLLWSEVISFFNYRHIKLYFSLYFFMVEGRT